MRAVIALDNWYGRDADRHLSEDRRLEDALWRDEWHALPFELELVGENLARQRLVPMELHLLLQGTQRPGRGPGYRNLPQPSALTTEHRVSVPFEKVALGALISPSRYPDGAAV